MDTYILSIGLNVGDKEPRDQLTRTVREADYAVDSVLALALTRGEWEGIPERTLQVAVQHDGAIDSTVGIMARILQQDCIAVTSPKSSAWTLYYADGRVEFGGSTTVFPITVDLEGVPQ